MTEEELAALKISDPNEWLRLTDAQAWVEQNDTRVRVPLNGKVVNLPQLNTETGGYGLCGSESEVVAVEGSPLTFDQLFAAVAAHVPGPPPPTRDEQIAAVVDAAPDWQTAMKSLASQGLLT